MGKRPSAYEFPKGLKAMHRKETGNRCELCNESARKGQLQTHHNLVYVSEGRGWLEPTIIRQLSNMLELCEGCHSYIHTFDQNRDITLLIANYGYLLRTYEKEQKAWVEEMTRRNPHFRREISQLKNIR